MKNITIKKTFNKFTYIVVIKNTYPVLQRSAYPSKKTQNTLLEFKTHLTETLNKNEFKVVSRHGYNIVPSLELGSNNLYSVYVESRIYFENRHNYNQFIEKYEDIIIDTYEPLNDAHEKLLIEGMNIETRPHLFYKKYKYRINFKWLWSIHNYEELMSYIDNIENPKKFNDFDYVLYLEQESDAILIQMALGENITRFTMIIIPDKLD